MAQVIELIFSDYNIDEIAKVKFSNFIDSIGDAEQDLSFVIFNLKKLVREYIETSNQYSIINEKIAVRIINIVRDLLKNDKNRRDNNEYMTNRANIDDLKEVNNLDDINTKIKNNYYSIQNTVKNKSFKARLIKESDAYNEEEIIQRRLLNNNNDNNLLTSIDYNNLDTLVSIGIKDLIKYEFIYKYSIIYVDAFKDVPHPVKLLLNKNSYNFNCLSNDFLYKNINNKYKPENNPIDFNLDSIDIINNQNFLNVNYNLEYFFSNPENKSLMNLYNLLIIKHFIYNHPNFKNPLNKSKNAVSVHSLSSLEGNKNTVIVIGVLIIENCGSLQIQDEREIIDLNTTNCVWDKAYFMAGNVVLCEGVYEKDVLYAHYILQPPINDLLNNKNLTLSDKIECDFFGAVNKILNSNIEDLFENNISNSLYSIKNSYKETKNFMFPISIDKYLKQNLKNLNSQNPSSSLNIELFKNANELINKISNKVIVLSNIDVSDDSNLNYFKKILSEYEEVPPLLMVLIGNFYSNLSFNSFKNGEKYFYNFARIINDFNNINNNTIFLFVPGNEDIEAYSGFPKHSFNSCLKDLISKNIKNCIFGTNPSRISVFGKDFVFFRDDLHKKLSRNAIGFFDKDINKERYYLNTVFGQNNLMSISNDKSCRIWHLNYSFLLIPNPDFLIISDNCQGFVNKDRSCKFISPGSFRKDSSFISIDIMTEEINEYKVKY